ncbi:MAG: D-amino acid dehydrogenase [Rhizobiales bacterium]|nr:D-amino acid dehydrogenase [Hyphomicrobiales bacterium]
MKIAIIGSGITGVTTADALLSRGHSVTVIDRHPYAAMETSYANGGQLSASNAEVWNSWETVAKGVKWMFKQNAPLLMNLRPSWHKYSWLGEFVAAIPRYRDNTAATVLLALEARNHLFEIAEREKIDFNLEKRGILHFYHDASGFKRAERVNSLLNESGLERRAVTNEEIRQIEPALKSDFYGGFYTPSDATGDIHKFTSGLAHSCQRRGATFINQALVTGLRNRDGKVTVTLAVEGGLGASRIGVLEFDRVIVCAGVGSRQIASMVGDRVNVYPVKGYSITVYLDDVQSQEAAPQVSLLDDAAKIVTSRLGADRFRVAGTAEFNGFNLDIRADRVKPLVDWSRHLFPGMSTRRVVSWAGLRPMLPDMMPTVRKSRIPGILYNTGHGHLGWTLSAATAQMVASLVDDVRLADDHALAS